MGRLLFLILFFINCQSNLIRIRIEEMNRYLVQIRALISLFHMKRLMQTYIIHITLLALCYSTTEQLNKLNFVSGTHFVDLAVEVYLSHFLKMTVSGLQHVAVTQCQQTLFNNISVRWSVFT